MEEDAATLANVHGIDILDAVLLFGTNHSTLSHDGQMGVLLALGHLVLEAYRSRDPHPRIAETIEEVFATGDPTLALATVLLFANASPTVVSLLLQHSNDTAAAADFLRAVANQSLLQIQTIVDHADGASNVLTEKCGIDSQQNCILSLHDFVIACRATWSTR